MNKVEIRKQLEELISIIDNYYDDYQEDYDEEEAGSTVDEQQSTTHSEED